MSDLKAACERLRRVTTGESIWKVYDGLACGYQLGEDRKLLVAAYLAEHPADEDEPVTHEWLRENSQADWVVDEPTGKPEIILRGAWQRGMVTLVTAVTIATPTRGHVRRLIAALGLDKPSAEG